jgi:hypothetical protein
MDHIIIRRIDGSSLLISSFLENQRVIEHGEQPIAIAAADGENTELKDDSLYLLYGYIDRAVDAWVQELKYIPRLINSAVAFLLLYFFFSFVIRDPLPMVDEIILASGGAVAVYLWTAAKNRKSEIAYKRRIEIKMNADRAKLFSDETAQKIEKRLQELEQTDLLSLCETAAGIVTTPPSLDIGEHQESVKQMLHMIIAEDQRQAKLIKKLEDPSADAEKLSARLYALAQQRKIDLPLIVLYRSL